MITINKKEIEKKIAEAKKAVRYNLESIDGCWYTIFDNIEKKFIEIHSERSWKKFQKENAENICTNF